MAKFTPGPLYVESGETITVREEDGGMVAQMTFLYGRHGSKGRRGVNGVLATARLFAVAPEMHTIIDKICKDENFEAAHPYTYMAMMDILNRIDG